MALHRKLRGIVGGSPQYVRIPASRTNITAVSYSLQETHVHAQRVYAKRCDRNDRSRKISSLQLRTCFVLCVLLYFGAIYFADDIASIGRVVGSEQNSQSFFVHSLRPRSRGNIRVGRAIEAKKVEETNAVDRAEEGEDEQQHHDIEHLELDVRPKDLSKVEKHLHEAKVANVEAEKTQATEPLEQSELKRGDHQIKEDARENAPANAAKSDGQDLGILAQMEGTVIVSSDEIPIARKPKLKSTSPVELSDVYDDSQNALRHRNKNGSWTAPQALESTHLDEGDPAEKFLTV
ncbi:unnamed protein product [Peronospora farinosa]|uniref:Transmembrane protein n=1 Tax=Peronospora farinosa TaxID=134698 RepID=A0AAV0SQE2_9STRA|nr:unnamed protein product [Peronospora farinosa]CAI5705784.1 unnamed protein product [Peronospora farinosa]